MCAHQKRDILLLVDGSASVGWQDMKTVKQFLHKLVMELNVGRDKNHVALAQFSEQEKTKPEFGFDRYYQARKISRAIHKMVYHAGQKTMLGHALEMADRTVRRIFPITKKRAVGSIYKLCKKFQRI